MQLHTPCIRLDTIKGYPQVRPEADCSAPDQAPVLDAEHPATICDCKPAGPGPQGRTSVIQAVSEVVPLDRQPYKVS